MLENAITAVITYIMGFLNTLDTLIVIPGVSLLNVITGVFIVSGVFSLLPMLINRGRG